MQAPKPTGRWLDHGIGLILLIGTLLALVGSNDMGFVRDEAFYFRHAETYQDWFVDVEEAGPSRDSALQRKRILDVWHNNAEHPPLNKILFGWSWRIFGRKLRPAGRFRQDKDAITVRVSGLGAAHGFDKGARAQILRPQVVGAAPDPGPRVLAAGEVTERTRWSATVTLDPGHQLKSFDAACHAPGPADGVIYRTGCEALEERKSTILSESAAMRAPGALFTALLVWLIWLTARGFFGGAFGPWQRQGRRRAMGRPFAALAAVGFILIPRVFYHAHLACFDLTIVAALFATTVVYHRSLQHRSWVVAVGVLWGLSLLTKHNALFFPIPLMAHWAWDGLAEGRFSLRMPSLGKLNYRALIQPLILLAIALAALAVSKVLALAVILVAIAAVARLQLPPMPVAWFVMVPVGFSILIAGWPLLWVDTLDNFLKWIEFHLHHEHYMQVYFGRVLAYPPFPFALPWVLTLLTWPLTLLVPALTGMGIAAWREGAALVQVLRRQGGPHPSQSPADADARSFDRLVLMSTIWPIVLIAMPSTPVFGGTKHWFLAYPFMLLLGGRALESAWALVTAATWPRRRALVGAWLLAALVALPAAQATRDVHPHGSLYHNELIGGLPGAALAGMQRQFWGGATRDGLAEVNRRAPKNARIWFHNSAWGAFRMYQREGWFRRDLSYANKPAEAKLGFFHHQRAHDDYELECQQAFGTVAPIAQVHSEGVPILSIYQRPGLDQP
ncbi:MAG: glycosyltransferase family 39 protein [Myxococcales bacterium]|nr:glycosyltransferase family 39 protein [Myxococcales bacterium]